MVGDDDEHDDKWDHVYPVVVTFSLLLHYIFLLVANVTIYKMEWIHTRARVLHWWDWLLGVSPVSVSLSLSFSISLYVWVCSRNCFAYAGIWMRHDTISQTVFDDGTQYLWRHIDTHTDIHKRIYIKLKRKLERMRIWCGHHSSTFTQSTYQK